MFVDGKPIPFSVNSTISYSSEDKQNGSLYNKVRVSTVDISRSRQTDVLEIGSTALVEKGVWSIKKIIFLLWKQLGAGKVSHFLVYFDEFPTSLDGFKNSSAEFFWKHPVFWFCFLFALNKFTLSKSKGELWHAYLLRVFLRTPLHISKYILTSLCSRRFRTRTGRVTETHTRLHVYKRSRVLFGWQFSRPTRILIPSGGSKPIGIFRTLRKRKKIVSWASRAGAPSPLACLPRTPRRLRIDRSHSRSLFCQLCSIFFLLLVSSSDPCPPGLILHASAQYCQGKRFVYTI